MDKLRQDYQDGMNTLKMFLDATGVKMSAAVQVSFLNVRAFVQDVEVGGAPLRLRLRGRITPHLQTLCRKSSRKSRPWRRRAGRRAARRSC